MMSKPVEQEKQHVQATPQELRVKAVQKTEVSRNEIRLSKELLGNLGAQEGQELWTEYQGRQTRLKARAGNIPFDQAEIHPEDLKALLGGIELRIRKP
jgi:hypothetical protein